MPEDVVAALGSGKRPAVTVTVNGYRYRSTVASMGGVPMVSLSAAPREVTVPDDLAAADRQVGRDPAGGPSPLTS